MRSFSGTDRIKIGSVPTSRFPFPHVNARSVLGYRSHRACQSQLWFCTTHTHAAHIARHGVPERILTDKGPQFIASEYNELCRKYEIQHITSSPYWPKGNEKAETVVKVVKRILKKSGEHNLHETLLTYRNTPQDGHTLSPSQRCMGHRTRGLLPVCKELLLPNDNSSNAVRKAIAKKRANAKQYYDKNANSTPPTLAIGGFVYAKPAPHHKSGTWLYGIVIALPNPRSYIMETPTVLTKRNRSHLRPSAPPPPDTLIRRVLTKHLFANSPQSTQSLAKASSPELNHHSVNETPGPSIENTISRT